MPGVRAGRRARPARARCRHAVVVLTGYGSIATPSRRSSWAAVHYLPKPADCDEILAALGMAVGTARPRSRNSPRHPGAREWEPSSACWRTARGTSRRRHAAGGIHRRSLQRKLRIPAGSLRSAAVARRERRSTANVESACPSGPSAGTSWRTTIDGFACWFVGTDRAGCPAGGQTWDAIGGPELGPSRELHAAYYGSTDRRSPSRRTCRAISRR